MTSRYKIIQQVFAELWLRDVKTKIRIFVRNFTSRITIYLFTLYDISELIMVICQVISRKLY